MMQSILRRPAVESTTGLSRSAIYDRINPNSPYYDPTFPTPIRLGGNSVGWLESEISDWINSRIEAIRKLA